MRFASAAVASLLVGLPLLALSCSTTEYPDAVLVFDSGQEKDTFDDATRYEIYRFESGTGVSKRLLRDDSLPDSLSIGHSGTYQFVGTAFDKDGNRVAVGRTLFATPGNLLGAEIPMFFARTDKASRPLGSFLGKPMQDPVASVFSGNFVWFFDDSAGGQLKTDAYSLGSWEHYTPPDQYATITCPKDPCDLQNVIVVGNVYALLFGADWAMFVDTLQSSAQNYVLPKGISKWSEVVGGRVMPGEAGTAALIGPARQEGATKTILALDSGGIATVYKTHTARAGAATLSESPYGLVIVGGSADGAGVELLRFDGDTLASKLVEIPYPADPVTGAALVMEDDTHLLRVGGLTEDGSPAPTVRIDIECSENCALEPVAALDLALNRAESFYDPVTEETLVVGQTAEGLTQVYRYRASGFLQVTIPKNQARVKALALELPNQQLALVGGTDPADAAVSRTALSVIAF